MIYGCEEHGKTFLLTFFEIQRKTATMQMLKIFQHPLHENETDKGWAAELNCFEKITGDESSSVISAFSSTLHFVNE